jgi:hypothetical protein
MKIQLLGWQKYLKLQFKKNDRKKHWIIQQTKNIYV